MKLALEGGMSRAKKPEALSDEALINARNDAQRLFMELDAEIDRRESEAAARALFWRAAQTPKAAGAVVMPEPAPKRVVVGAHKAVRVEDTGAPDGGRPSPAQDAFPPLGAQDASDRLESVCLDPLEIPAFLKRSA